MTFKKFAGTVGAGLLSLILVAAAIVLIGITAKGIYILFMYGFRLI